MAKIKVQSKYNGIVLLKSIFVMTVTFIPCYYYFAFQVIKDFAPTCWEGVFTSVATSPGIASQFWITIALMFYLVTMNALKKYQLIRMRDKKQWMCRQINSLFFNCVALSFVHTVLILVMNLLVFGAPQTFDIQRLLWPNVYVNYSIYFILFMALLIKALSSFVMVLLGLLILVFVKKPLLSGIIISLYTICCSLVLFYNKFLVGEFYKYLIFPSAISHWFFCSGSVVNNYLAGICMPMLLTMILIPVLFVAVKRQEFF